MCGKDAWEISLLEIKMVISLQSIQVLKTNFIYEKDTFYSVFSVFDIVHVGL